MLGDRNAQCKPPGELAPPQSLTHNAVCAARSQKALALPESHHHENRCGRAPGSHGRSLLGFHHRWPGERGRGGQGVMRWDIGLGRETTALMRIRVEQSTRTLDRHATKAKHRDTPAIYVSYQLIAAQNARAGVCNKPYCGQTLTMFAMRFCSLCQEETRFGIRFQVFLRKDNLCIHPGWLIIFGIFGVEGP